MSQPLFLMPWLHPIHSEKRYFFASEVVRKAPVKRFYGKIGIWKPE